MLEPEQLAELARHLVAEDLVAAAAGLLGRVHRDVGVRGSAPRSSPAPPAWTTTPMLAPSAQLAPGDRRRAPTRRSSSRSRDRRSACGSSAPSSSSANSSPPSRASVSLGPDDRRRSARRPRCSSWSPASWPRLSFTCLKPSRSTSSTASGVARALGPRERLVEAVAEERAVGEAGQAVVERLPRELLLEPDALGHVAGVEHDAADLAVVAQVGDVRLEVAPLAEPVRASGTAISCGSPCRDRRCDRARGRRDGRSRSNPSPSSVRLARGRASPSTDSLT